MVDTEDKEKAEKLAAAKKRFEQLKKQKAKKAPAKKKEEQNDAESQGTPSTAVEEAPPSPQDPTDSTAVIDEHPVDNSKDTSEKAPPAHTRGLSISAQSKLRSESFRKSSGPLSPTSTKSPTLPLSSEAQNADLEKENKRLQAELLAAEQRWQKLEEELEELRVAQSDTTQLRSKAIQGEEYAKELETLKTQLASLQRQNQQLQSAASRRRSSTASPANNDSVDTLAQLTSKTNAVESLELELSKLHNELDAEKSTNAAQAARISALESELEKSKYTNESTAKELADLKANLLKASEQAVAEGSSRSSAETRIAQLEAELGTAKRDAEDAMKRSETLEKKVETLTTLHRESDTRSRAKIAEMQRTEREAKELRARLAAVRNENDRLREEGLRRRKLEAAGDAAGLDELEDEERARLQSRVRELEDEVFELRRGVWRDKRREMQPGIEDAQGFDDVDLSGTSSPWRAFTSPYSAGQQQQQQQQQHSTFTDVLQSGISAFTGQPVGRRRQSSSAGRHKPRKQSLGLLSEDDFEFDEDAFRRAQEEVATNRLERVREIKRGLTKWKGWRLDLVELRTAMGGVFEV